MVQGRVLQNLASSLACDWKVLGSFGRHRDGSYSAGSGLHDGMDFRVKRASIGSPILKLASSMLVTQEYGMTNCKSAGAYPVTNLVFRFWITLRAGGDYVRLRAAFLLQKRLKSQFTKG